jgi:hypothetical protein
MRVLPFAMPDAFWTPKYRHLPSGNVDHHLDAPAEPAEERVMRLEHGDGCAAIDAHLGTLLLFRHGYFYG